MDKRTPIAKFADALAQELDELWPNATVLDGVVLGVMTSWCGHARVDILMGG